MLPTQNGVDAPHKLAELVGAAHVVGGYTRITSLLTGPGAVRHTAIHPAVQGTGALPHCAPWVPAQLARCAAAWAVRACSSAPLAAQLAADTAFHMWPQRSPYLRLEVDDDVALSMWRKLTIMAAYSTVTAVARCPIGPVVASPDARATLLTCMHEVAAVARAAGVRMTDADVAACLGVLETLPEGCTPSMQRDLLAGRPSELDDQAGAVVRIAAAHGVATPVLGALYALLRPQERAARCELVIPPPVDDGRDTGWPPLEYYI